MNSLDFAHTDLSSVVPALLHQSPVLNDKLPPPKLQASLAETAVASIHQPVMPSAPVSTVRAVADINPGAEINRVAALQAQTKAPLRRSASPNAATARPIPAIPPTPSTVAHTRALLIPAQAALASTPAPLPAPQPEALRFPKATPLEPSTPETASEGDLQAKNAPRLPMLAAPSLATPVQTPITLAPTTHQQLQKQLSDPAADHQTDYGVNTKATDAAIHLAPRVENMAFSLRMANQNLPVRAVTTPLQQPVAHPQTRSDSRIETKSDTRSDARPPAPQPAGTSHESNLVKAASVVAARSPSATWNQAQPAPLEATRAEIAVSDQHASPRPEILTAAHEVQPVVPEVPRPRTTGEIVLQLSGKDQPAAIRVSERAGTVNVSVHAADPELRNSLRSNLSELSSQLNHQGWKAEVVRPGMIATPSEGSHDSRPDGQRSPGHQQSFANGERQTQKDRRGSSDQWLAAFEEQNSTHSGKSGGNN